MEADDESYSETMSMPSAAGERTSFVPLDIAMKNVFAGSISREPDYDRYYEEDLEDEESYNDDRGKILS